MKILKNSLEFETRLKQGYEIYKDVRLETLTVSSPRSVTVNQFFDQYKKFIDTIGLYQYGYMNVQYIGVLADHTSNIHIHSVIRKPWQTINVMRKQWQNITKLKSDITVRTLKHEEETRENALKYFASQSFHHSCECIFFESDNWCVLEKAIRHKSNLTTLQKLKKKYLTSGDYDTELSSDMKPAGEQ